MEKIQYRRGYRSHLLPQIVDIYTIKIFLRKKAKNHVHKNEKV